MTITVKDVLQHLNSYKYMEGVKRTKDRVDQTGEIFTRNWLVMQSVDDFLKEEPTAFDNHEAIFLEPCCGDGEFLSEILIRKMRAGSDFETALKSIRGIDVMADNVDRCRERLLCGQEHLRYIIEKNIVCANALKYHYRFDGTDPDITEQDLHNRDIGLFAPKKSLDTQ